jgi:hypothetical protein
MGQKSKNTKLTDLSILSFRSAATTGEATRGFSRASVCETLSAGVLWHCLSVNHHSSLLLEPDERMNRVWQNDPMVTQIELLSEQSCVTQRLWVAKSQVSLLRVHVRAALVD